MEVIGALGRPSSRSLARPGFPGDYLPPFHTPKTWEVLRDSHDPKGVFQNGLHRSRGSLGVIREATMSGQAQSLERDRLRSPLS